MPKAVYVSTGFLFIYQTDFRNERKDVFRFPAFRRKSRTRTKTRLIRHVKIIFGGGGGTQSTDPIDRTYNYILSYPERERERETREEKEEVTSTQATFMLNTSRHAADTRNSVV